MWEEVIDSLETKSSTTSTTTTEPKGINPYLAVGGLLIIGVIIYFAVKYLD